VGWRRDYCVCRYAVLIADPRGLLNTTTHLPDADTGFAMGACFPGGLRWLRSMNRDAILPWMLGSRRWRRGARRLLVPSFDAADNRHKRGVRWNLQLRRSFRHLGYGSFPPLFTVRPQSEPSRLGARNETSRRPRPNRRKGRWPAAFLRALSDFRGQGRSGSERDGEHDVMRSTTP
jgi:hypothetical protein